MKNRILNMETPPAALRSEEQFVSLLARNHSRILGYILALVPHRQDAEDLFQKVSMTLWSKFGEYEPGGDFFAWASRVAFFTVCNHRRAAYRDRLTFSQELIEVMSRERIAHLERQGDRLESLLGCVERLPSDDRQLLMQVYSRERTVREIAERTGRSAQTLYNRLTNLRRELVHCVHRKLEAQGH